MIGGQAVGKESKHPSERDSLSGFLKTGTPVTVAVISTIPVGGRCEQPFVGRYHLYHRRDPFRRSNRGRLWRFQGFYDPDRLSRSARRHLYLTPALVSFPAPRHGRQKDGGFPTVPSGTYPKPDNCRLEQSPVEISGEQFLIGAALVRFGGGNSGIGLSVQDRGTDIGETWIATLLWRQRSL